MARDPKAEIEISAHSRGLRARLREARSKFSGFAGELKKNVFGKDLVEKGFWGKAGASMVGNMGANALGAIGGMLASQGKDVLAFEDSLTRLRIATGKTPEEMAAFGKEVRKISTDVGIGAAGILEGAHAYVALTGDMDGAIRSSRTFGRVAQATNSSVAEIAQTAAAMKQQMGIGPEEMEATFSALAVQGKAGAIELKDLASQMSTIAPQWAQFAGGKGLAGVKELGASLQIVKRGFGGDAGETVTGLQSFLTAAASKSKQLKAAGFDVFTTNAKTGKKELKGVLDIVDGIANSKLAKNPTKLIKALGRVEAYRAFIQLRDNREELDKLVDTAGDAGAIQRDLDTYSQSVAGRTKLAWQKAKNEIAEAFTPERIERFAALVVTLSKAAATIAGGLSKALGFVEDIGTGMGMLIGGDTEDMRATKMQNAHRDDRAAAKASAMFGKNIKRNAFMEKQFGFDAMMQMQGVSPEQLAEVRQQLGREEAFATRIAAGGRDGGTGGYSIEELQALRKKFQGGASGFTNEANVRGAIDAQLDRLIKSQEQLAKVMSSFMLSPTDVKIGADPVATASKNAPQNAKRPGA